MIPYRTESVHLFVLLNSETKGVRLKVKGLGLKVRGLGFRAVKVKARTNLMCVCCGFFRVRGLGFRVVLS